MAYDGFISYSHAADDLLAPRLQAGLQRFAKPWWKRRALRVFRDESSLSANPHLWQSITEALDTSGWFVLLLSPDAARSEWVNQEVAYWVAHNDSSRILPVVTAGEFGWSDGDVVGDAVPDALQGVFPSEPRWVDLRFAKGDEQLDLQDPRFADAIADVASAMRGVPKDELAGEEVRQHRRTVRTAWAAGTLVALLAVTAVAFGVASSSNARLARSRELAASAQEALGEDPELATLLALQSLRGSTSEPPGFLVDTLWRAAEANRLVYSAQIATDGSVTDFSVSPGGDRIAAVSDSGVLALFDSATGEERWSRRLAAQDPPKDVPMSVVFHPSGDRIAVSVADGDSFAWGVIGGGDDGLPNRVLVLDAADGSEQARLTWPDCLSAAAVGWSSDGARFVVSSGWEPCSRDEVGEHWIEVLDATTFDTVDLIDVPEAAPFFSGIEFTDSDDLVAFGWVSTEAVLLQAPDYSSRRTLEGVTGVGRVSPDGSVAASFTVNRAAGLALFDVATTARFDALETAAFPSPLGITFSPDGTGLIVPTEGLHTHVFDVRSGKSLLLLPGGPALSGELSADNRWAYTGHVDGTLKKWDLQPRTLGQTSVESLWPEQVVNARLASGTDFGAAAIVDFGGAVGRSDLVVFDARTGKFTTTVIGGYLPQTLADDRFVFRIDGRVMTLDPATGVQALLAGCESHDDVAFGAVLDEPWNVDGEGLCVDDGSPAENLIPIASIDGSEVMLWDRDTSEWSIVDPDTGSVVSRGDFGLPADQPHIRFSDEWIFTMPNFESGVVLDRRTGHEVAAFRGAFLYMDTSPEGSLIAGADSGTATFVNTSDWVAWEVAGDFGDVRAVAFSPSGELLAVSDEYSIVVIDVEQRTQIRAIPVGGASGLHWMDESTLLVGARDPSRWISVSLDPEGLVPAAAAGLTRGFTELECREYAIEPCPTLEDMLGP